MSATAWQQPDWGVQQPQPLQQQTWASPTHPGPRTNLLAMLAIGSAAAGTTVLLGLGSIAAIVLGCIALAQIRRTGEDGRLLAIWSIVLGAVTLVALVAAGIGVVAMIASLVQEAQALTGN